MQEWVTVCLAAFILLGPVWYNGYPLVYSDTGTYIFSGMDWEVPVSRPVTYGLFIRWMSVQSSLWGVVMVQAVLLAYVLRRLALLLYPHLPKTFFLIIIGFVTACSAPGWYVGQIMPDIFAAMAIAAAILVLNSKDWGLHFWITSVILVVSIAVHSSHAIFLMLLLLGAILLQWGLSLNISLGLMRLASMILLGFFMTALSSYMVNGRCSVGQGKHVFLMGRMLDSGVLHSFLYDHCDTDSTYALCPYKDNLPADSRALLWDNASPLYQLGGWKNSATAFNPILTDILKSPKHLGMLAWNSTTSAAVQLFQNDLGTDLNKHWYREESSPPYQAIRTHFRHELKPYLQSRQNGNLWKQNLDFTKLNEIHQLLLLGACLFLLYWLRQKPTRWELYALLIGIVANAIVTAALANVYSRLQARVSWLLIFVALVLLFALVKRPRK